jgi:hypothetical protein
MSERADAEALRHAALECLAVRHPAALPLAGIARRVRNTVDFGFTDADLSSALAVLVDAGLARSQVDPLGSSLWWNATAAGVLQNERRVGPG